MQALGARLAVTQIYSRNAPGGSPVASLSRGASALAAYLQSNGLTSAGFAKLIPCSETLPWMWANNKANPSRKMARRIEQITGGIISRSLWDQDDEIIDDPI